MGKSTCFNKALFLLAAAHLVIDLSSGALPVILPFFQKMLNLTYAQVGIIVLMQNLTSSVIQPIFGYITDKTLLPGLLPISVLFAGIGMALTGLTNSYESLLAAVILCGVGVASFHPQASKTANFVSKADQKGRSMGIFSVGGNLGMGLGAIFMAFLLSLSPSLNNTLYFVIPAIILTLFLLIHKTQFPTKPPAAKTKTIITPVKPQWNFLILLLLFIFVRSSIHGGLMTYIPLYYINYLDGSPLYASSLVSVFLITGALGTFIGGTLSDRYGRKMIIVGSMLITLPLLAILPYTTGLFTMLLCAIIGFVLIASFATTILMAQELMPGYVGMASGLTIGFSIGLGGISVTLLGLIADTFGLPSVFHVMAVLPLVGILFASRLPGKVGKKTVEITQ